MHGAIAETPRADGFSQLQAMEAWRQWRDFCCISG
jgi:hypothetical protein